MYASTKREYGCPLWLWNPENTSQGVQNRGISGPTNRTYVLQNFFKKRKNNKPSHAVKSKVSEGKRIKCLVLNSKCVHFFHTKFLHWTQLVSLQWQMAKNTTHFWGHFFCKQSSMSIFLTFCFTNKHHSTTRVPSMPCTQCVVLSACLTPRPIPFQYATRKVYPKPYPGAPQKRERGTKPLGAGYDTLEPIDVAYGAKEPWLFCYMKDGVVFGLAWWEDHGEILKKITGKY